MASKKFLNPINLVNLASDPGSANEGDIYYNTTSDVVKVYANSAWVPVGNDGGSDINVSTTAPSSPATGDAWYKNDTGEFYVYDGAYWVEVNGVIEGLTQEQVQDYVAPLFTHANHTNASVTYEDASNELHIDVINAPTAGYTAVLKHDVRLNGAIAKGQAVYVSSSNGTNMVVSKASNASEATSSKTIGLLETGGANNALVKVVTEGLLAGLDTSTAGAEGDPVWLGTDGNLIYGLVNKPVAPAHLVFIGIVTRKNVSNGEIFVKVQNGFELREIHDVLLEADASITDNEVLAYDTTSGLWKNQTASEAGIATTTGTETLTNKTLTTPKINEDVTLTATSTELNVLDGITASTAELNILDGVTSSAAELNILDGATLTTTELNYVDGVTSAIQTQIDSKSSTSHNHTVDSLSNVVITGTPTDGQGLVWDTTTSKWINETVSSVSDITSLTDVTISGTIADNEVLAYDTGTSQWINQTTAEAGLLDTSATAQTKAGDLTITGNLTVNGTTTTINSTAVNVNNQVIFEGTTADGFETTLTSEDPTADQTITLPNATGTVALTSNLSSYALVNSPSFTGNVTLPETTTIGGISTSNYALVNGQTFTGLVVLPSTTTYTTSLGSIGDTELKYLVGLTENVKAVLDVAVRKVSGLIEVSDIPTSIARAADYVPLTQKGQNNGVAGLDSSGKVPSANLDLSLYATLASSTFSGNISLPSTTSIGDISSTVISYLSGISSNVQTQINDKLGVTAASTTYLSITSASDNYQAKDADLTAIAGLAGTNGFLKKAGSNTWVLDENTYLTTGSAASTYFTIDSAAGKAPTISPTFTGTVVLPATTSIGDVSATEIGYLDGVTSSIQTQIGSKASSSHTHSYQDADSDLTAIAAITSGVGLLKRLGPDTWTIDTNAYITGSSPTISTSLIAGTSTFNLINSVATTVNFAGAATTLIIGSTDAGGSTTIRTPAIATTSTSLDLFNTIATTVNFAGAATTFNLGGTPTGSLTATLFGNATTTTKTINIGTGGASGSETNINIGSSTSGATGTVSVYPSTNFVGTVTVPTPTSSGHATTKSYVDALAAGITVKSQVVYVSQTNLNATYANGTSDSSGGLGVGATLTGNVDGALILDGPEVEAGQRVLIKDQTNQNHNGIYVVTFAGDGDDPFILTRATDFNGNTSTNGIIKNGAYIFVTSGTTSANDSYVVSLGGTSTTPSGAIKIGTDNIVLAQYSGVPSNISTLGYVTTGTWAATPIDKDYIDVEIARTNDPVFTGHVTVPDPTDDTDATSKQYVDDLIFASLPYLPDIIPLDDLRYEFDGINNRFLPKFQGEQVAINNPLKLLLTINGIIQTVDFPEYVWQSMLPREGFMVDSDGYLAFSEVPPVGSTFDARVMLGPNVNSIKKGYPFRAVDILLGA